MFKSREEREILREANARAREARNNKILQAKVDKKFRDADAHADFMIALPRRLLIAAVYAIPPILALAFIEDGETAMIVATVWVAGCWLIIHKGIRHF